MKYKKYFRKTSLKQKGVGDFFLDEVRKKNPKVFLEVGVFHGVTARNVCELLYEIHNNDFKYIGLDLFEKRLMHNGRIVKEQSNEISREINIMKPKSIIGFMSVIINDPKATIVVSVV